VFRRASELDEVRTCTWSHDASDEVSLPSHIFLAFLAVPGGAIGSETLAQKNACTACHAMSSKLGGPSFADIRSRYASDPGALAKLLVKTKAGGAGSFGSMPMPPQRHVPDEVLSAIVKWMLDGK
jgi:cytochrome c